MGAEGFYPYQAPIDAYGNGGFRFAGMSHHGSLLCLPSGLYAWNATSVSDLSVSALQPVLDQSDGIESLLIGLGDEIRFVEPELRRVFRSNGIVVEGLATGSAVRIYNIMLAESRPVAAALIAVDNP